MNAAVLIRPKHNHDENDDADDDHGRDRGLAQKRSNSRTERNGDQLSAAVRTRNTALRYIIATIAAKVLSVRLYVEKESQKNHHTSNGPNWCEDCKKAG